MAYGTLLAIRGVHPHIAHGLERIGQNGQLGRMDSIVVGDQDSWFCHATTKIKGKE
jgi:hypothetical protein